MLNVRDFIRDARIGNLFCETRSISLAVDNIMAYDSHNVKYSSSTHPPPHGRPAALGYAYSGHSQQHFQQTDENRNENNFCGNKELTSGQISQQSSGTQTIQKVDAATMTDPLQIDFRLTSEYFARCSSTLGLPYVTKYENSGNNSIHSCQEIKPKLEFEIEPQHINGESTRELLLCQGCFLHTRQELQLVHKNVDFDYRRFSVCIIIFCLSFFLFLKVY